VPKITLITRKAYGGAYDVMSSKHLRADFNFGLATAEIAVNGTRGCGQHRVQARDRREHRTPEAPGAVDGRLPGRASRTPYSAAERGYIDDVIVPTRRGRG